MMSPLRNGAQLWKIRVRLEKKVNGQTLIVSIHMYKAKNYQSVGKYVLLRIFL